MAALRESANPLECQPRQAGDSRGLRDADHGKSRERLARRSALCCPASAALRTDGLRRFPHSATVSSSLAPTRASDPQLID